MQVLLKKVCHKRRRIVEYLSDFFVFISEEGLSYMELARHTEVSNVRVCLLKYAGV
jgi:hypothetical protein